MNKKDKQFDFAQAAEALKSGKPLMGKDGILTPLIKSLTEAVLEGELEAHLLEETDRNRRNGHSSKTIKSPSGTFELETPRDRNSSFEPQIVKKYQTTLGEELQEKILAMYAQGMSYKAISGHLEDIYGVTLSNGTLSTITDRLIDHVKAWQARPLNSLYPIVWLDAIHYKIKEDGQVVSKAVYTVLGISIEGKKEVLGLYIGQSEGAKFWLQILTDMQNRGVEDILIACVDGLKGFPEAIETIYPEAQVQLCIVHKIRSSLQYVSWKDRKEFARDLKPVYEAPAKEIAELRLAELEEKWAAKYQIVFKSWRRDWENLSHYFGYPEAIRRIIYTTNAIEAVHRQFRKLTKTKGAFPTENSLLKLLYLGVKNAEKNWRQQTANWSPCLSQLAIIFESRLEKHMEI